MNAPPIVATRARPIQRRPKWKRLIVASAILGFSFMVGALAWLYADRSLSDELQIARAAVMPIDLTDIARKPIPDSDNAAGDYGIAIQRMHAWYDAHPRARVWGDDPKHFHVSEKTTASRFAKEERDLLQLRPVVDAVVVGSKKLTTIRTLGSIGAFIAI